MKYIRFNLYFQEICMKKYPIILLSMLLLLSGCVHRKGKKSKPTSKSTQKSVQVEKHVNIPLASDELKSYFDDQDDLNLGEFVLVEDAEVEQESDTSIDTNINIDVASEENTELMEKVANTLNLDEQDLDDFSWVHEIADKEETFEKCHFKFDRYSVEASEEEKIEENIKLAKKVIDEGGEPTIVIEGHSCHSAGSMTYNLVLSEKRAKVIADRFVAAGVPAENIKIVPRGQECPEKDEFGHEVTGSRDAQWPNRRGEVRVVYS